MFVYSRGGFAKVMMWYMAHKHFQKCNTGYSVWLLYWEGSLVAWQLHWSTSLLPVVYFFFSMDHSTSRALICVLLVALFALVRAVPTDEECRQAGFRKNTLYCSTCEQMKQFVSEQSMLRDKQPQTLTMRV